MGTKQLLICLLLVAACVASWFVLKRSEDKGRGGEPREAPAGPDAASNGSRNGAPPTAIEAPGTDGLPRPVDPPGAHAPLAGVVDEVGTTFLGETPQVAELLRLIEDLAGAAVVDPASVQVLRDADRIVAAHGTVTAGGLRGTFHIEDGTYRVHFPTVVRESPWSQRDLQFHFEQADSRASGCRAVVQYQVRSGESASAHLGRDEEKLIGWTIAVTPATGAQIRPMTVAAQGDEWMIGSRRSDEVRELPAVTHTAGFDAWLRVLQPTLPK